MVIPPEGQIHSPDVDELLEAQPMSAIVAAGCNKCGSQYMLIDEDIQDPVIEDREMGSERYYWANCQAECGKCEHDLTAEVAFSVYAFEWVVAEIDCENCEIVDLNGFELPIEEGRRIKEPPKKGDVEETELWAESPTGCAVFVEGKTDQFIVTEFLRRVLNADPASVGITVLTGIGGGREFVVKSAAFVANVTKRVQKELPYVIVLDGDAIGWAKTVKGPESRRLFLLSKKEIESYLMDPRAIARAFASGEREVASLMQKTKGEGKEPLEFILKRLGIRPTPQVKQIIARHLDKVPDDFVKLAEIVQRMLK